MKINIFEGGRRIRTLLIALWAFGTLAMFAIDSPSIRVAYRVDRPGMTPTRVESGSCNSDDATEYAYARTTNQGTEYNLTLCFSPFKFPKGLLVPFRTDNDGTLWGDEKYSGAVTNYTQKTLDELILSAIEDEWIDSQRWKTRLEHWKDGAQIAAIGAFVIFVVTALCGWILRGFMGIPAGKDARPWTAHANQNDASPPTDPHDNGG